MNLQKQLQLRILTDEIKSCNDIDVLKLEFCNALEHYFAKDDLTTKVLFDTLPKLGASSEDVNPL
jgi:hypothetical protein